MVICPASLRINWKREAEKWLISKPEIGIVLDGKNYPDGDLIICNYEILGKHESIKATKWDIIIADESHYCKGKSQRTKNTLSLRSDRWVFLTGTPILNRPAEIWNIAHKCAPKLFPNWWGFAKRYCDMKETPFGMDTRGASNLGELNQKLSTFMIRRKKVDVLKDLPPKRRQIIELPPTKEMRIVLDRENMQWKVHEETMARLVARRDQAALLNDEQEYRGAANELKQAYKVAFGDMAKVRQEVALAKLPLCIAHIKDLLESVDKILVFCRHKAVAANLMEELKDFGAVVLMGDTAMNERQKAVDAMQNDPKCRVFVGSIQAAGVGITLTAASTVVFVEPDWTPALLSQCEDRCLAKDSLVFCLLSDNGNRMALKCIQDIKIGDKVLSHTGLFNEVTDVLSHYHDGPMTTIKYVGFHEPLICTHDHKIWVRRDGINQWVEAHQLMPSDSMAFPRQKIFKDLQEVEIKPEWRMYADATRKTHCHCGEKIEARGLCRIHYRELLSSTNRPPKPPQRNARYKRLPDKIAITDRWLYLFGWFVAEGFSSLAEGKAKFVSFSGHEKERPILESMQQTISEIGVNCSIFTNKKTKGIEMRAYSTELARWFRDWFGFPCDNICLPDELMHLPPHRARILLQGYTDGDGFQRKNQTEWVSISKALAWQMCLLAIRSGFIPTFRNYTNRLGRINWVGGFCKFGNPDNKRQQEQDADFIYRPIRSVSTEKPENPVEVFDLSVANDHSFTCGLATVHNCWRYGQKQPVLVQHLVLEASLDSHMLKQVMAKQEIIDQAIDAAGGNVEEAKKKLKVSYSVEGAKYNRDQRAMMIKCLRVIADKDKDSARQRNGEGFSMYHSQIGKSLAGKWELTDAEAGFAAMLVKRYRGQVDSAMVKMCGVM